MGIIIWSSKFSCLFSGHFYTGKTSEIVVHDPLVFAKVQQTPSPGKIISLWHLRKLKHLTHDLIIHSLKLQKQFLVRGPQSDLRAISSLNLLVVGARVNRSDFKVILMLIMSDNYMKAPSAWKSFS